MLMSPSSGPAPRLLPAQHSSSRASHTDEPSAGRSAGRLGLQVLRGSMSWRMLMRGWRARLGFLIPPGNPTVEPELTAMTPPGVSIHFSRLVARGAAGTHQGQEERNRDQIEHIDQSAELLAMVKPDVI